MTSGSRAGAPDPSALRDLAVRVAVEAGELLQSALGRERAEVSTKSTTTDMVTEMDAASEELIVGRIAAERPHDAVIGEEGAAQEGSTGVRWVIDPLDGTTNYLYRLPGWNVSVGVELDGVAIAGAVVVPGHGDVFAAAAGAGATRNGRGIQVAWPAPLTTSLVGTGFSYEPAVRARQARVLVDLLPAVRDVRRGGAAATDLCSVACGRLDLFFESGLAPWDRCAGSVVVTEAGGRIGTFDAGAIGALTVASHPDRWDEWVGLLGRVGAFETPDSGA